MYYFTWGLLRLFKQRRQIKHVNLKKQKIASLCTELLYLIVVTEKIKS